MQSLRVVTQLPLLTSLFLTVDVHADIYKCTDVDGSITYSQTPCRNQKTENVKASASTAGAGSVDCTHANKFALTAARLMRGGASSTDLFNRYGGLDSISRGTNSIINYVYTFRTNEDVAAERIAALTQAKCRARSLGNVSCEALPLSYTESLGGCNPDDEQQIAEQPAPSIQPAPVSPQVNARATSIPGIASDPKAQARAEAAGEACKKRYRDQIDSIDAQMRSGFSSEQGEVYREKLHDLTQQLRQC